MITAEYEPCPYCNGTRRQRYRSDGTKKGFHCSTCARPADRERQARHREQKPEMNRARWHRWFDKCGVAYGKAYKYAYRTGQPWTGVNP